jgi:hypothetical protein
MKQRRNAHQRQQVLFDQFCPHDGPSLDELPPDRNLELQAAVGELLVKAASKGENGRGGDHDA